MNDKTREATVIGFPQQDNADSEKTRLGLLALELGDMRMQIERLRYDMQNNRARQEKSEKKIKALKDTVASLRREAAANAQAQRQNPAPAGGRTSTPPRGKVETSGQATASAKRSKSTSVDGQRSRNGRSPAPSTPPKVPLSDDFSSALDELTDPS